MTLCSFGRSVLVLTLVRGVTTVSIISGGSSWRRRGTNRSVGAAIRQTLACTPLAALWGHRCHFSDSQPVLGLGVLRQFQVDQGGQRAGFVQFPCLRRVVQHPL